MTSYLASLPASFHCVSPGGSSRTLSPEGAEKKNAFQEVSSPKASPSSLPNMELRPVTKRSPVRPRHSFTLDCTGKGPRVRMCLQNPRSGQTGALWQGTRQTLVTATTLDSRTLWCVQPPGCDGEVTCPPEARACLTDALILPNHPAGVCCGSEPR